MKFIVFDCDRRFDRPGELRSLWEGEPLERPEQLPYAIREELTFGEDAS